MKSAINLESLQQTPQSAPNPGGQPGVNRNETPLFNAILKNHMRISDEDVATDKESMVTWGKGRPSVRL